MHHFCSGLSCPHGQGTGFGFPAPCTARGGQSLQGMSPGLPGAWRQWASFCLVSVCLFQGLQAEGMKYQISGIFFFPITKSERIKWMDSSGTETILFSLVP